MEDKIIHNKNSILLVIIIAGEAVFFLPFVLVRIFRPTLLEVFNITNTQLGSYFFVYGIVAMISYLFGGFLADRFSSRNLMSIALLLTAIGGVVMSAVPDNLIMKILYGFWGFTSIFLFWAAMIRATREWGSSGFQGRAFGWLEGGRGAVAALLGSISFFIFAYYVPEGTSDSFSTGGLHPFQIVIISVSVLTLVSGLLVWFVLPNTKPLAGSESKTELISKVKILVRKPGIWMLAIMIVCAYLGYKITDDFSLYAKEVLNMNEVQAAGVGTSALWLRAVIAVLAGYLGDAKGRIRIMIISFSIATLGGFGIASGFFSGSLSLSIINLIFVGIGVYGIRALYFAVLKEANIALAYTGTAVGIVSFVGYTPDIFTSPLMGYLLDNNPGEAGHRLVFLVLSGFATVGFLTSLLFAWNEKKSTREK